MFEKELEKKYEIIGVVTEERDFPSLVRPIFENNGELYIQIENNYIKYSNEEEIRKITDFSNFINYKSEIYAFYLNKDEIYCGNKDYINEIINKKEKEIMKSRVLYIFILEQLKEYQRAIDYLESYKDNWYGFEEKKIYHLKKLKKNC